MQRGETLYKIGLIPLGGYVHMVGEGTDVEENDNYPRSFKNKTVLQRMVIISAGVIMNVLFGLLAFIAVYRFHGVDRPPAVVWQVEGGSAAWKAGVHSDSTITRIGNVENPYFDDLRYASVSTWKNQKLQMTFQRPNGTHYSLAIEPRKDRNDPYPVIGITAPSRLKLLGREAKKYRDLPVLNSSPAAVARVFDLQPGDVVLKAGAKDDSLKELPTKGKIEALCELLQKAAKKDIVIEVRRAGGKVEQVDVPAVGFEFGDMIVGTTDANAPDRPFDVKDLPLAKDVDEGEDKDDRQYVCDPFVFRDRLRKLAGQPMVIRVVRAREKSKGDAGEAAPTREPVNILVPAAFHHTLGMFMKMGEVAAVRDDSPASRTGLVGATETTRGDELKKIVMDYGNGKTVEIPMEDPTRLPFELRKAAAGAPSRTRRSR